MDDIERYGDFRDPCREVMEAEEAGVDELVERVAALDGRLGELLRMAVDADREGHVPVAEAAGALGRVMAWVTAGNVLGRPTPTARRDAPEDRPAKIARMIAVRSAVAAWVLCPQLLPEETETTLARKLAVTKSLVSHYATMFSREFGTVSRGMKSSAARSAYAERARGNGNRKKK